MPAIILAVTLGAVWLIYPSGAELDAPLTIALLRRMGTSTLIAVAGLWLANAVSK